MVLSKNKKVLIIILFFVSGIISNSIAQEFTASVDRTTVGQYDRFQIYFTFNGPDINSVKDFRPPSFPGFKVLSGPNQSTSMQIINGKVSSSLTFIYILQPSNVGNFAIGPASVEFSGKTYRTNTLSINVEKGTPQQQQQSTGGYTDEELAKNVFIVAEANKNRVYLGEQLTVTYKLYTKLNISSPQITKLPQYQGFWAVEVDPTQTISFDIGMYKGERYRVATIKRVALFPTKTGQLSVTPFELNIPIVVKKRKTGNDVFDEFFNDSFFGRTETVEYQAKSNTLKVEVDQLPSTGVPSSFTGAVGNFNFKTEIDKNNVVTNESITLRLTLSGSGNIQLLKAPEPQLPAGVEKYDPKVYDNVNKGAVVSGQKIVEYLLVPRMPGEKEIPSMEFSYFNPSTKKYITINSPVYKINIVKGTGQYEPTAGNFSKEDVRLLSEDIRFIKTSDISLERKQEISFIKPWFWLSLFLPVVALLAALGYRKRQDKLYGNIKLLKYQKAEKAARQRLKISKRALDENKIAEFYSELSQALFGYLEDKLGIQKSEFTLEGALEKLSERKIENDLLDRVKTITEKCEFVRFAPQGETSSSAMEIYNNAVKLIIDVDSALERKR
ncbi:MAG: BatD family protein [Melioribacteraceae bacterium]|nr:BatD family protein [Melioribacteraceae bacterium]